MEKNINDGCDLTIEERPNKMMHVDVTINKRIDDTAKRVYLENAKQNHWTSEDYNSDSSRIVLSWAKKAALKAFQDAIKQGNVKDLTNDEVFHIAFDNFKNTKPRTSDFY